MLLLLSNTYNNMDFIAYLVKMNQSLILNLNTEIAAAFFLFALSSSIELIYGSYLISLKDGLRLLLT